jgi:hypothetical protein
MSTSLVMTNEQVKMRVNSTNSFTRDEMTANRHAIKLAREEKKERLSKVTGAQMGSVMDQMIKEGYVLHEVKDKHSKRANYRHFIMRQDTNISEEDRLRAQIEELKAELAKKSAMKA